jgi:diguanylate cyclase (GGDEF)-like protein
MPDEAPNKPPINKRQSTRWQRSLLDSLRLPTEELSSFEPIQRQARVLHTLLIFLFFPLLAVLMAVWVGTQSPYQQPYLLLLEGLVFFNLLALTLLRFGYLRAAARILVLMAMAAPWISVLIDPRIMAGDLIPLMYITLAILLSTLLLPVIETALVAAAQTAILLYLLFWTGLSDKINAIGLITFIIILTTISIVINYLRDQDLTKLLEQARRLDLSRKRLHRQTILDPLTGLYNRRHFENLLEEEIQRSGNTGATIGILLIDVDDFKNINDTHGHEVGDMVLREIAKELSGSIRQTDFLIRHGGDELVVVMPGASLAVAGRRAEQFRANVEKLTLSLEGKILKNVTLSIGATAYPFHGETREALMRAADQALYQAKDGGRNKVILASLPRSE